MAIDTINEKMSIMGWQVFSLPQAHSSSTKEDRLMFQGLPAVDITPPIGTSGEMTEGMAFGNFGDFGSLP